MNASHNWISYHQTALAFHSSGHHFNRQIQTVVVTCSDLPFVGGNNMVEIICAGLELHVHNMQSPLFTLQYNLDRRVRRHKMCQIR